MTDAAAAPLAGVRSVGVVGAGIVGLAVARELGRRYPGLAVTVIEKEPRIAAHQSGHNSGVVHAGVYYAPGSLKAALCRRGSSLLREFCAEHGLPFRRLGKLIVATSPAEVAALDRLEVRARANGVPHLARLVGRELAEVEPFALGVAALHSPSTATVDYGAVCAALAREVREQGGRVLLGAPATRPLEKGGHVEVTVGEEQLAFERLVVCAGLHGDELVRVSGARAGTRIVPFRGEYYALRPAAARRVRGMIYPVPDPRYPFLGVHLTRDVHDGVTAGPNAVLALALEGYRRRDVAVGDLVHLAGWPGTWRLARRHWRAGLKELAGSLSKRRYLGAVRRYLPDVELDDLVPAGAGVRAQAVDRAGRLVDDFLLDRSGPVLLVRNAPSPAATSSLAIAEHVVSVLDGGS